MQRNGSMDSRVSDKGWRILDKEDRERANHAYCLHLASAKYASESGRDAAWFCIIVATGREKTVQSMMLKAGIQACVPMRAGPQRKRRYRILPPTMEPVMTGYIMVRCVFSAYAARAIHAFEHVLGMVGGWDGRLPISDEKMNTFIEMADSGLFDWERPAALFRRGVVVEVTSGPFASFRGPIVNDNRVARGDAVVELTIFGRVNPVMIPLAILQPV